MNTQLLPLEEEVKHHEVTRLQDKCEYCGKVAKELNSTLITNDEQIDEIWINLECGHLLIKKLSKGTPFHTLLSDDNKKPYPFQVEGMRFIESALVINKGAAIFDEMGLGKTIQALGYFKFHSEALPVLFIVKSGIKFQWVKEILRWLGDEYVPQVISSSGDLVIPNLRTYIISYDLLIPKTRTRSGKTINQGFDITKLSDIKTVILDECQQIKNPEAVRTQQVRRIVKDKKVIALSGTPWKNRGSEFFTVLNMMAPMKFTSYQGFIRRWVDFYYRGQYIKQGGIKQIAQFREYIKDIAIRREIFEVMKELPDVNRTMHHCELDKLAQSTYDEEVSEFVRWYNSTVIGGEEDSFENQTNMLAKIARMRHITGLAKIPATVEFAKEFIEETDRKLCIFVHHKDVGEILYNEISKEFSNIRVFKLTADLSSENRFKVQEDFNAVDKCIMIASTGAAGEGINLQSCSDAILHERQWNPQNEDQAAPGRFRRIGSTASVINVTFMTAAGTVDEIIGGIVESKRGDFHNTMNKGDMPTWSQSGLVKEIAEKIVKGFNITKKASLK